MVTVSSDGHAHYEGNGRLITPSRYSTDDSVPDTEQLDFTASQSTIDKIFDLAKRANYFQGDVENKKRNLAFTGKKTLTYTDGTRKTSATYNYPSVAEVQELTHTFQGLSSTLEFGRRLEYCHRHQKLALDQESKQMESSAQNGGLKIFPRLPLSCGKLSMTARSSTWSVPVYKGFWKQNKPKLGNQLLIKVF